MLFGADPEVFAVYEKDGEYFAFPPVSLLEQGIPVEENGDHPIVFRDKDGGYLHIDGAAFEMCVPPSSNWENVWEQCDSLQKGFEPTLGNFPHLCEHKLKALPTVNWEVDRWQYMGAAFDYANRMGCDKDFDVWKFAAPSEEVDVMDATYHPYRYGGGHIHVSGTPKIATEPLNAIEAMILTVGLAATAYSTVPDLERLRTFRFGRPSKHRIQNYPDGAIGVEYRTPSCSWVGDKSLAKIIFEWAKIGIEELLENNLLAELKDIHEKVAYAITNTDQELAVELLEYVETKL